jgi:tetratricopeptide (TPR) repeat protein
MFGQAIALDPAFARAHAGLSFSHFQSAFMSYTPETSREAEAARRHAERAIEIDALDPFANFTHGRALWLRSDVEASLGWLDRAVSLSPNYAQAIYARAWAENIIGDGEAGRRHADLAMALSPLDPLHYAMLAARALSHLNLGEYREAAEWGDRAARAPGAHVLIAVIAAASHALHGDRPRAQFWSDAIGAREPGVTQQSFFRSFPFRDAGLKQRISEALSGVGR